MPRIPYYEVENATGKHAEFLDKLKPHLNIYRMLANSEAGLKGFIRMGNALLYRCELDAGLRELAIGQAEHQPWGLAVPDHDKHTYRPTANNGGIPCSSPSIR